MRTHNILAAAALACSVSAATLVAQQPAAVVDGKHITMTGCVTHTDPATMSPGSVLVWTRGDLLLSRAVVEGYPVGTAGVTDTPGVLYYLDKNNDLLKHMGKLVEVKGSLKDVKSGEVKVDHQGDFTEVRLKLDGHEDKVRVPTAWFGTSNVHDRKYDIIARKVDVDHVKELGVCPAM